MAIPMPGLAAKGIDINTTIEKLVKVKREPLKRMEAEIGDLNQQKDVWAALRQRLVTLGNLSKRMYDYTNPFGIMLAESGEKDSFTATAERKAKRGPRRVQVHQIAASHRIASDALKKEKQLPGGIFTVELGTKKARVDFSFGGTLADLAARIETVGREVVRTSLTHDTPETSILVLDAVEGGAGNVLRFSGDTKVLFEAGFLKQATADVYSVPLGTGAAWTRAAGPGAGSADWRAVADGLELSAGSRIEFALPRPFASADGYVLEYEIRIATNARVALPGDRTTTSVTGRSNIQIGPTDPVRIQDLSIFGSRLIPGDVVSTNGGGIARTNAPAVATTNNGRVLYLVDEGTARSEFAVPALTAFGAWQKVSLPLASVANLAAVRKLVLANDNQAAVVGCRGLALRRSGRDGLAYKNELLAPRDAILTVDGIRITRRANAIGDAIEGVNLRLLKPGSEATLEIKHDVDLITKYILEFVEGYNQALIYVNAVTKHLTREERDKMELENKNKSELVKALEDKNKADEDKHRGKMPGEMTLSQLKSAMGIVMMSPYETRLRKELALLMQIGISTGKTGATWADLKASGGALEVDTSILKSMIERDILAVAQLFGNDTNGDSIIDQGACLRLYDLTRTYTQPGNSGVIAVKVRTIDRVIVEKKKTIDRAEMSVKAYEDRLRTQFASMETKVRNYQDQSRWLNRQD